MVVRFGSSSSINHLDETLGCESLPLSCVHSIKDGAHRFHHVVCDRESLRDRVFLIGNRRLRCRHMSIEVHQVYLISVVTLEINGGD